MRTITSIEIMLKKKKDHIFNFENMDFDIVERIDKIKHFY